jgi:hypothetical protein
MLPLPAADFAAMQQHLTAVGVPFRAVQVPGGELWQIFVSDPNGVMLELNYTAANERD